MKINDPYYWGSKYIDAKHVAPSSVLSAKAGITLVSAKNTLSKKTGQIGEITVTKKINLWKRDAKNNLKYVRVLNVKDVGIKNQHPFLCFNKSSIKNVVVVK